MVCQLPLPPSGETMPWSITDLSKHCFNMQVNSTANVGNKQTHTHRTECEKGFAGNEGLSHRAQEIHGDRTDTMRGIAEARYTSCPTPRRMHARKGQWP